MVIVAQLVRASDCGSEGRGFETRLSPKSKSPENFSGLFFVFILFEIYCASFLSTTNLFSLLAISQAIANAYFVLAVTASNSILSTSSVGLW